MADQKLIEEVGKYIDKYYKPAYSDIKMDKEMLSVFEKITKYREKRAEEKRLQEKNLDIVQIEKEIPEEFDVSTIQKTKIKKGMSSTMSVNRNIDHLMDQMEETDLDDGVKVNYEKFQGVEVAQEGQKALKVDLLAKLK